MKRLCFYNEEHMAEALIYFLKDWRIFHNEYIMVMTEAIKIT